MFPAIGLHVSKIYAGAKCSLAKHIDSAIEEYIEHGIRVSSVAVFLCNPHSKNLSVKPEQYDELRAVIAKHKLRVTAHNSYVCVPWSRPEDMDFIQAQLTVCSAVGIEGLVVHLPKSGIETVIATAAKMMKLEFGGAKIFFETPALKPENSNYESPAKLKLLYSELGRLDADRTRFGLCIDTAHLWSCGVDLRTYEQADSWFRGIEGIKDILPRENIMLHLNDSEKKLGAGADSHAPLRRGNIWGKDAGGLNAVADFINRNAVMAVVERSTKEEVAIDFSVLRDLIFGIRA